MVIINYGDGGGQGYFRVVRGGPIFYWRNRGLLFFSLFLPTFQAYVIFGIRIRLFDDIALYHDKQSHVVDAFEVIKIHCFVSNLCKYCGLYVNLKCRWKQGRNWFS